MNKILKIIFLGLIALLICAYLGLWFYSQQWFAKEMDKAYASAQENNVEYLGPKPRLTNFPFVPTIYYTGGVKTGEAEILFPEVLLRGYPLPGLTLKVMFPKGVSLGGIVDPKLWALDFLEADIAVPARLPRDFTQGDMQAWKDADGKIDIRHYAMIKSELNATGKGLLTLDTELQPVLRMESRISGHDAFIEAQLQKGLIEPFPAAIGRGLFGSLARPDPKTGENVVSVTVNVENRALRVGPILVLELPEIVWDTHSPPDLRL